MAIKLIIQSPKRATKSLIKQRPLRSEIDLFKTNLLRLLSKVDEIEREENQKNHIRDFLRDTFYKETNEINTKDNKDLVIHLGKTNKDKVGVIIEAKRPSNKNEMFTADKPNTKAFQELVLYYLRERIEENNIDIKYCIATNIYEWFIIEASYFENLFFRNKAFVKEYQQWRDGKKVTKDTNLFYNDIAKPFIDKLNAEIPCTCFDIRNYEKTLQNADKADDNNLLALLKVLSPFHLLKIPFADDSNQLDERFYKELLHIIGLEEAKVGSKFIIRRKTEGSRSPASLLEKSIEEIKTRGLEKITDLNNFGETAEEQLFNISLELCITWVNRILFLKLMEGQLVNYHNGDASFRFLNTDTINNFTELFNLFHNVLAKTQTERTETIRKKYSRIPYLNSSLFEISELEDKTITINDIDNPTQLELLNTTILKEHKKKTDKLPTLDYLFKFLDAYDFASEGKEDIQEDVSKTIINASVLGKVFEKINGYKDGSIFTPAFITMYMCRQSIRLAVLQKLNEKYGWKAKQFDELKNYLADKKTSKDILNLNKVINSLLICDPAVGSGHFLVSSLNEIIAVKSELGLFADEKGIRFPDYEISVENDELLVTDHHGNLFQYIFQNGKPQTKEAQRMQKILFHEKQTIIENSLFGVDINPNSVKICRLRLWIELLKNAYYKEPDYTELETLPNIDINIKCGNSLLSRFSVKENLSEAFRSQKFKLPIYKSAVQSYRESTDRKQKRELLNLIDNIKKQYTQTIYNSDPRKKKISDLRGKILLAKSNYDLFGKKMSDEDAEWEIKRLTLSLEQAEKELEKVESGKIYHNAFEWRFEFPEALNDNGEFEGFDIIIGNPPYIKEYEHRQAFDGLRKNECYQGKMDIWYLFGSLGLQLLKPDCYLCFIATNNWVTNAGASNFRNIVLQKSKILNLIDFGAYMIFENASIQTMIMLFKNNASSDNYTFDYRRLQNSNATKEDINNILENIVSKASAFLKPVILKENLLNKTLTFSTGKNAALLEKIKAKQNFTLDEKSEVAQGIVPNPDIVNSRNILKLPDSRIKKENIKIGDGVFIVPKNFFKGLSVSERKYIKPVYEPYLIDKYSHSDYDKEMIYLTKKNFNKGNTPKLISHLEKFHEIMEERRENKQGKIEFCHLHWPRDSYFFEKGEKILSVRKCAYPTFLYTENETFVMMSFNVIRSKRINLKYLSGLLNSKLTAFWLKNKGKMQGNNYQIDKEPLLEIPIYKPSETEMKKIADLVDKIISQKQKGKDSIENENKIDELVYKLYDFNDKEIKIVEGK